MTAPLEGGRDQDQELLYQKLVRSHEEQIRRSNRFPNLLVAWLLGLTYSLLLILTGVLLRIFGHRRPDWTHRRLAEFYPYVPEMALHKAVEVEALSETPHQGRGLDLGCGNGQVGGVLAKRSGLEDLHGIDLMPYNGPLTRTNGYRSFVAGSIDHLPFQAASFDYVFSICVLEHIPDLRRVLEEVRRVLVPGGTLSFTTPAPRFRECTLGYLLWQRLGNPDRAAAFQEHRDLQAAHFHYRSSEEWSTHLTELGFEDIRVEPLFGSREYLVYEIMNAPVNFLQFYFSDKLSVLLSRHLWLGRVMTWATAEVAANYSGRIPQLDDATHYTITCRRPGPA